MNIMNILKAPDPILLQKSIEVDSIDREVDILISNMFDTMYSERGLGLAAVQVGVLKRIIVIGIPEDYEIKSKYKTWCDPIAMINPELVSLSTECTSMSEGCLSIPKQQFDVKRPSVITVKYKDQNWNDSIIEADGWLSRCIQHEIDHLNGILFLQHLSYIKRDMAMKKAKKIKLSGSYGEE